MRLDEVKAWQSRPLETVYPIVYLDAIVVKIRVDKQIVNKAIHLALAITMDGEKELLGMWCAQHEGAKFWLSVLTELKNRGLQDIRICCCDGLTGFPAAIEAVYPKAKYTKSKGAFVSENALMKLVYCACQKVLEKWTQPMHNWALIISQLQIYFEERLNLELR